MLQKRIRYLLTLCAGGLIGLLSLAKIGHAETIIDQGYLHQSTTWDAVHSPYIIEDQVFVPRGISLHIKPGTKIVASSSLEGVSAIYVEGSMVVQGDKSAHVSISGPSSISISIGIASVEYADISLSDGIGVYDANFTLQRSTVSGSSNAITTRSSSISIEDSKLFNNRNAVTIQPSSSEIFPVQNNNQYGMGGIGNMYLAQIDPKLSNIIIKNSSISNNSNYSIRNLDSMEVVATNNWWGSDRGPMFAGINKISGIVKYEPWLAQDPDVTQNCCSSILFIPGLEGSRLHMGANQLWEPNRDEDVKKLYLNSDGSSNNTVEVGDPIGKAYGIKEVYGRFIDYLYSLKNDHIVNSSQFFAYDWRKPISEVVQGKGGSNVNGIIQVNQNLVDIVSAMASSSKTNKVTLIAHSNGGLVAKYLVKTLTDLGKEYLIDKVISVGVPYIGTPQAIAGLLHGDGQSIAGGAFLGKAVARLLGQNMPSAYSLLPTESYFTKVFGPTIAFASTSIKGINNGVYPKEINTYQDQVAFVSDSQNSRQNPKDSDLEKPIKGNISLLDLAKSIHSVIDSYSWPISISKWAIAGWNLATTKSIYYYDKNKCVDSKCKVDLQYKLVRSNNGDGTVVTPSASYDSDKVITLDLATAKKIENKKIDHSNILSASSTIGAIDKLVTNRSKTDKELLDEISKIPGVTIGEIDYNREEPAYLQISTHSPVDLHVYDEQGRHVGVVPVPSELDIEEGLVTFVDEEIDGVSINPGQGYSTYVYMNDEKDARYDIVVRGNNFGTFDYQVERVKDGKVLDNIEYKNIPVTPFTVASTSIITKATDVTSPPKLANILPPLEIDQDGNGTTDYSIPHSTKIEDVERIKIIRNIARLYCKDKKRLTKIEKRLDKIEEMIRKGNFNQKHDYYDKMINHNKHFGSGPVTDSNKAKIMDLMEIYISQFE
jgi:pimeloyl-ACP methyl ester carboxylesterase